MPSPREMPPPTDGAPQEASQEALEESPQDIHDSDGESGVAVPDTVAMAKPSPMTQLSMYGFLCKGPSASAGSSSASGLSLDQGGEGNTGGKGKGGRH